MILSDRDIISRLADGSLVVEPLVDPEIQIQPASIDLCLGEIVHNGGYRMDGANMCHRVGCWVTGHTAVLEPGAFTLGSTRERVRIPPDLVGVVDGRSSWGRRGLAVHVTAGYIDPGFEGEITLEFVNLSNKAITLQIGMRLAQLRLHTMVSPSLRPYGHPSRNSKYQGQMGATESRIAEDNQVNDAQKQDFSRNEGQV